MAGVNITHAKGQLGQGVKVRAIREKSGKALMVLVGLA
jgi:hypothetical protein